ncbi:hypothetical protein ACWEQ3_47815, partial [Streptomyces mirabilis]
LAVAETFANAPGTREALSGPHPTLVLQPQAEPPASRGIERELRKRNSNSGASAGMEFRKRNSDRMSIRASAN